MKELVALESLLPETDYQALMAQLQGVTHPRRKLRELQNKQLLTRLKKGFYVLSRELCNKDYSLPIVANLLYGPSYLSLEFALSRYGLIPERVETFTSVTIQKNKEFSTSLGTFTYRHLSEVIYPIGTTFALAEDGRSFLIATAEKALLDIFTLKFQSSTKPRRQDLEEALFEDLRVDRVQLRSQLQKSALEEMRPYYQHRIWCKLLLEFLLEEL